METCRLCGEESHIPLTCDENEKDSEVKARTKVEMAMTRAMLRECVRCQKSFIKDYEGCNSMRCVCGQIMCYVCNRPLTREHDPRHFGNSPGKCPLYSDMTKLHTLEVLDAAEEAKANIGEGSLKHDPSKEFKMDVNDADPDPSPLNGIVGMIGGLINIWGNLDGDDEGYDDEEL